VNTGGVTVLRPFSMQNETLGSVQRSIDDAGLLWLLQFTERAQEPKGSRAETAGGCVGGIMHSRSRNSLQWTTPDQGLLTRVSGSSLLPVAHLCLWGKPGLKQSTAHGPWGMWLTGGEADQHMAGLVGTVTLPDLTPLAAEAGAAEGDPRPVYKWVGPSHYGSLRLVRSYPPSGGGAPRLVADVGPGALLGVWDTGTGAFLGALTGPPGVKETVWSLVTYQRPSDGRPRVAAGSRGGQLCIWDGDDLRVLHSIQISPEGRARLAVYEEPTSGSTRLVNG
jgi:hypothetical protein